MPESNSSTLGEQTTRAMGQALSQALDDSGRRKMLGLIAADTVVGMGLAARSHALAERLARKTQDGTLGQPTEEPADELLANMNISVGDTVHIEAPPAPVIAAPAPATTSKKLWPYVLAAALASGGLGAGAAALLPSILSRGGQPSVAPPAQSASIDTDTQYEVRISSGQPAPQSEQGPPP